MKVILTFFFLAFASQSATMLFATPPNAQVSASNPVDTQVMFITSADQMEIRVYNFQQETTGSVAQTISAVDWTFGSSLPVLPVVIARSGLVATLNFPSTKGAEATLAGTQDYSTFTGDRWSSRIFASSQITGGTEITTLVGKNPNQTILGPADSLGGWKFNGSLSGDNPFLYTPAGSYISWTLQFDPSDHVTAATQVTRVRMSWNTAFSSLDEMDLVNLAPEPGPIVLCLSGIAFLCLRRRAVGRR